MPDSIVKVVQCPCGNEERISINRNLRFRGGDCFTGKAYWNWEIPNSEIMCTHCGALLTLEIFQTIGNPDSPQLILTCAERIEDIAIQHRVKMLSFDEARTQQLRNISASLEVPAHVLLEQTQACFDSLVRSTQRAVNAMFSLSTAIDITCVDAFRKQHPGKRLPGWNRCARIRKSLRKSILYEWHIRKGS